MERFYIDDHALIYGLLGKYAEEQCAQGGVASLKKATIQYAKERGIRMAKRCLADGRELSMQSYLLYAEWADTKGWSNIEVSSVVPEFRNHVEKCGWYETWKKYGLMKYGAVYCSFVDKNLVKGFNPALEVDGNAVKGFSYLLTPVKFDKFFTSKGEIFIFLLIKIYISSRN